jgi:hypothetical protein
MKEFRINQGYRGRYFEWRFCAKSYKDAAEKIGSNVYGLRKYAYCNNIDNPYDGIFLKPYSHNTRHLFDYSKEYELSIVKSIVDAECNEKMKGLR